MIRREKLSIVITCNGCGQVRQDQDGQRAKFKVFKVGWQEAQAEGWSAKAKPDGKGWDHFCPDCKEAAAAA